MTAKVLLVRSHHAFNRPDEREELLLDAVELHEEMLEWPLYLANGRTLETLPRAAAYRNLLRALLSLDPFGSAISIRVDLQDRRLLENGRDWAEIHYNGEAVARFTHDRRKGNVPFGSILMWPELDGKHALAAIESWTPQQWQHFFVKRIREEMNAVGKAASAQILSAQKRHSLACEALQQVETGMRT